MLSKKYYILLGHMIQAAYDSPFITTKAETLNFITGYLSEMLKDDNPDFSEERFRLFINREYFKM